MQQLLLLLLLCGSAAIFSMEEKNIRFSTKHYGNCKETIMTSDDDYVVYELTTGNNIKKLPIPNKDIIYGEIKKNSVISVVFFPIPNKKEKYGEYRLEIATDKKTNHFTINGKVMFTSNYNQRAKENDSHAAPLFNTLRNDLANFEKNNFEKVKTFFVKRNINKDIKQNLLNTVFIQVLDESPEIVFPNAYHQQKQKDYKACIEPIYHLSLNKKSSTLKHF